MLRTLAVAAAMLAACSAAPDAQRANAASATSSVPVRGMASRAAATPTAPAPGTSKTFKDWIVACDNVKRCAMASLGPEAGEFPEYALQFAREAGPAGGWAIELDTERDESPVPAAFAIDAARLTFDGDQLAGARAAAVVAAAANGHALAILDAAGKPMGNVSLAGAAAALRYIDAAQGRAGGVTAVVAKGPASAANVPAAPSQPTLAIVPIGDKGVAPTAAQVAQMRKLGACEETGDGTIWAPEAHALDRGRTLVILPCSMGAYNVLGALFVIDGMRVDPAQTDAPAGFDQTGADSQTPVHSVVNGGVDAGQLTSYAKGRGLGDCGTSQTFAWDGARLRLTGQDEMNECRGNRQFLRTWTARAVRR